MAGESAREAAQDRRHPAERDDRAARRFPQAAEAEDRTTRALGDLPAGRWYVKHDLKWPGRRLADIDHLVVGPGGVFVIDSRHWAGRTTVAEDVLRHDGRMRDRVIAAAEESAIAVTELLPGLRPEHVNPVLCFGGDEPASGWAGEVMVCSTGNLVRMLLAREEVLTPAEVRRCFARLYVALPNLALPNLAGQALGAGSSAIAPAAPLADPQRDPVPRPPAPGRAFLAAAAAALGRVSVWGLLAVAALVVVGLAVTLSQGLRASVGTPPSGPVRLGDPGSVPAGADRPALTVTPRRIVATTITDGHPRLAPGHHLLAVELTLSNQGSSAWVSRGDTQISLSDRRRHRVGRDPSFTGVRVGPTWPSVLRLGPGQSVTRYAVFDVPRRWRPAELTVRPGPGEARTVGWSTD